MQRLIATIMNIERVLNKIKICYRIFSGSLKPTFSQFGEDRILDYLFTNLLKSALPSYIDIGANHPVIGNNTFAFYIKGATGILIEPDPYLFAMLKKARTKDKVFNVGVGFGSSKSADFYVYPDQYKGLNTFSTTEAELRKKEGIVYEKIIEIPLLNINTIIKENTSATPDLISIDVEGLDFEIIKSLDFVLYSPKVICLETIRFGDTKHASKATDMIDYILDKGYFVFADTYINTIFCKKGIF